VITYGHGITRILFNFVDKSADTNIGQRHANPHRAELRNGAFRSTSAANTAVSVCVIDFGWRDQLIDPVGIFDPGKADRYPSGTFSPLFSRCSQGKARPVSALVIMWMPRPSSIPRRNERPPCHHHHWAHACWAIAPIQRNERSPFGRWAGRLGELSIDPEARSQRWRNASARCRAGRPDSANRSPQHPRQDRERRCEKPQTWLRFVR
jgi:hypothetical protein